MTVTTGDVGLICAIPGDLSGYLESAQVLVSEQLQGKGLTDATLDQITIYLAAHFAVIGLARGGLRSKKIGDAAESYRTPGDKDVGFKATAFGQQALIFDTTGTLSSLGANSQSLPALFSVVGSRRSCY